MSTALVTGATGFIGRHLCERLLTEGWTVTAVARTPAGLGDLQDRLSRIIPHDLAISRLTPEDLAGVVVVFHCAANVNTWDSLAAYHTINVAALPPLLEAMAAMPMPPRLVHLSTVDVYGFPLTPCDESAPIGGAGFGYGDSKALGEAVVIREAQRLGLINFVVPAAQLQAETAKLVARLAAGPTRAYGLIKQLVDASPGNSMEAQGRLEAESYGKAAMTEDLVEGIRAFLGKRPARFAGQ